MFKNSVFYAENESGPSSCNFHTRETSCINLMTTWKHGQNSPSPPFVQYKKLPKFLNRIVKGLLERHEHIALICGLRTDYLHFSLCP